MCNFSLFRCRTTNILRRRLIEGPPKGGRQGALCPRVSGSKGPHSWRILTTENALKCILSQAKAGDGKFSARFARRGHRLTLLPLGLEKFSAALINRMAMSDRTPSV